MVDKVNLILFGPPGAGKGTQAQYLAQKYNYYQLSTGDLLRSEIQNKTSIGNQISEIIGRGEMVTDDIVDTLIANVIKNDKYENKIIFDGYPRNIKQAKNLSKILIENNQKIELIIFLNLKREDVIKRIESRITCNKCNKTFNEHLNIEEIDNHECGRNYLKKRKDDNEKAIIARYDEYMKKTKPVLDFYSTSSHFYEIDGSHKIQEITSKIEQILTV